ncbi:site-2 protease family protein [Humisphaera borealis]|uniref:Zinc metalloprotease n=1 Tax=Humisphaera borealis TaxID=2807512 RepID=A0A7M2WU54_9BACT|nr:site-2 protease family protein [Humisphaera borealis]QOV89057.1 site-2 protease family protein [Humisphaera borealis]
MSGAFRIARFFGIDLRVHWSFFFIVLLVGMQGASHGAMGILFTVTLVALLFLCVTLHEFGHALVAQRFGIPVREIVLLPIGGVAVMGRMPEKPRQELLIAIAGPLVNVAILAVLVPVWFVLGGFETSAAVGQILESTRGIRIDASSLRAAAFAMLGFVIGANVMLIAFNMIPAFPLDGGRVFRSILAMRMPHAKATRIAATVGQAAAIVLALVGLSTGQWMLAVIAFFIFMGAGAESAAAQTGTVLATRRVGDAYNKTAITLTLEHRMSHVIEHIMTSYQPDFAVLNRGRLAGVITREDVLKWLAETPSLYDVYVTEAMREEQAVVRVQATMTLDEVTKVMEERQTRVVAVFEGEMYLGLVSAEDIAEAQAVLTFLNRRLAEGAPPPRTAWPMPMREAPRV